jgi:polysaccharide export outer membrane protein
MNAAFYTLVAKPLFARIRPTIGLWVVLGLALQANAFELSHQLSRIPAEQEIAQNLKTSRAVVGSGDLIGITVFGQPDMSAEIVVGDAGRIALPLIGQLNVAGLSPERLEELIASRLKEGRYLTNPTVSVQIKQSKSQVISILGEVLRPGRMNLQSNATLLEALANAGGLTNRADADLFILRKNATQTGDKQASNITQKITVNIQRYLKESGQDMALAAGDTIYVPVQKIFFIHGEIRKPGAYPIENDMNIMKALAIGGGIGERGSARRISIHRKNESQMQVLSADMNTPIQDNDVIYIDERFF